MCCGNSIRLARNLREGVNVLADWCQRGVRVIAVAQQIDLCGPVGNLIASLLFGIAEIELHHAKTRADGLGNRANPRRNARTVYYYLSNGRQNFGMA